MALSTFVKISGITNLSDARYCAGMYVDLLGFSLEKDADRYVSPTQFKEITGWISGVEFVGEFETYTESQILETLKEYPEIKWIERDRLDPLISFEGKGFRLIYKMNLEEVYRMEEDVAEKLSESGIIFHVTSKDLHLSQDDLEAVKKLSTYCKVILGTDISAKNVNKLVKELNLKGIALTGGDEIKPGLKDFNELADILEALEVEE
ncbi:MAG: phosphoribosylanthranilate isomerase [Algoriphagus sp.]|uniref:phosphoribosylanthranilate isomerase n=1 Tax=Algoriphagus sp. TaxID=1872435 RepID=UPI002611AC45|nr:phosphoribosylanthranilate isomerase [Algoriphagus sp.]MDG1279661.1 phosphoribosylanthranilate isomerase [Algoriphagus sp.]